MKKETTRLTTSQFARLHNVNKRTLHYYDSIGLCSPKTKGDNGYRYYDLSQSIDFEYILMLKELKMSIGEITDYIKNPSLEKFLTLSEEKEVELDAQIKRLQSIKKMIHTKKKQVESCIALKESSIEMKKCKEEKLLVLPYDFYDDDLSRAFSYMKDTWNIQQIRMGVGGIITVEKILKKDFSQYDGLYTPALNTAPKKSIFHRPAGDYLCCYHRGKWDTLPLAYEKILAFAAERHFTLTGYAYEIGLNEFAISDEEDYVTQIMIKVEKPAI